jgi:hypothetical protein
MPEQSPANPRSKQAQPKAGRPNAEGQEVTTGPTGQETTTPKSKQGQDVNRGRTVDGQETGAHRHPSRANG